MGKKVYFLDSVEQSDGNYDNTYGVDDVNAIVSNLVGAGIAPFPSGDTYDVSELNSLTSALVAEGTSLDGLKVSFADNKIHIAQGIGYFENGATIVVDGDGEELDYNVAETLYVYAEYNQALNTCGFYTSESEPTSSTGIYVLILATIAADGTVTDKRVFAQSKIATLGRNVMQKFVVLTEEGAAQQTWGTYDYGENAIIFLQSIDLSRFNTIFITGIWMSSNENNEYTLFISIDELIESGDIAVFRGGLAGTQHHAWMNCKYEDGCLALYVPEYTGSGSSANVGTMKFKNLTVTLY